jgi:hypothetical protein
MKLDNLTFWIFFGFWPLWLVWELVLVWLRHKGWPVDLISMEARERAYRMNVIPFIWSALAAHFWLNWARPYEVAYPAVIFWGLVALVGFFDFHYWNIPYNTLTGWVRVMRWPGTQVILGLILGLTLFPQRDVFKP